MKSYLYYLIHFGVVFLAVTLAGCLDEQTAGNTAPTAIAQSAVTNEDTSKAIVLSATDTNGDTLTYTVLSPPNHGALSGIAPNLTYTPAPNYSGSDSFTFEANDGELNSNVATVSLTVTAVNDGPPVTTALQLTLEYTQASLTSTLTASDMDGDNLSFTLVSNGKYGNVVITNAATGAFTYTPNNPQSRGNVDTFTFKAFDGTAYSNIGTASIYLKDLVIKVSGGPGYGSGHSCVLTVSGKIKCWGNNTWGELGLGDTANRGVSLSEMGKNLPLVNLGTGITAKALSSGGQHNCAILNNNSVKCWGRNMWRELGIEEDGNRGEQPSDMGDDLPPVNLGTGRTAKAVATGSFETCVLLDNDSVKCWGSNRAGIAGLGHDQTAVVSNAMMGYEMPSINLGTGRSAKAIAKGSSHACAILDNNSVKCWGGNNAGQLGLGDNNNRGDNLNEMGDNLPPVNLGTGLTAKAIVAGGDFTCALLNNDTVKCWGDNMFGQLGLGHSSNRGVNAGEMGDNLPVIALGTGRTAKSVTMGVYHACAILDNNSVKCWGKNSRGQLGLGDTQSRGDSPYEMGDNLPAVNLGTGRTAKLINIGDGSASACAILDNDSIKCWGDNGSGQLGIGNSDNQGDEGNEMGNNLPFIKLWD
jgi:alpha-tubulin suppressor-like RCC1 family protein